MSFGYLGIRRWGKTRSRRAWQALLLEKENVSDIHGGGQTLAKSDAAAENGMRLTSFVGCAAWVIPARLSPPGFERGAKPR